MLGYLGGIRKDNLPRRLRGLRGKTCFGEYDKETGNVAESRWKPFFFSNDF